MLSVFLLTTPLWGTPENLFPHSLERTGKEEARWGCFSQAQPQPTQENVNQKEGLSESSFFSYLRWLKQGALTASTLYGAYWLVSQGDTFPSSPLFLGIERDYGDLFSSSLIHYESALSSLLLCALGTALTHSSAFLMMCTLLSLAYKPVVAEHSWELLSPTGGPPPALSSPTMSVLGNDLYLFGGAISTGFGSSTRKNDLWRYANNTWEVLTPTGGLPEARSGHTASVLGNALYVFGGAVDNGPSSSTRKNDLWRYANNTWEVLTPTGGLPEARSGHTASMVGNALYIFGGAVGSTATYKNDLWRYINNTWEPLIPNGSPLPTFAYHHTMNVIGDALYFSGGGKDLWRYGCDSNAWVKLTPTGGPPARRYNTMSVVGDALYLFGGSIIGFLSPTIYKNDLWRYRIDTNTWTSLTSTDTTPSARSSHTVSVGNDALYIFGGYDGSYKNDLWILTDLTLTPTPTPTPTSTPSPTDTSTSTDTSTHTNTDTTTSSPTSTGTTTPMSPQEFPPLMALKGNQFSKDLTQRHIPLTGPLWYQVLENNCSWLRVDNADQRFVLEGSSTAAGTCQITFKVTNEAGEEVRVMQPVVTPVNTRRGNSFSDIRRAMKNHEKERRARSQLT